MRMPRPLALLASILLLAAACSSSDDGDTATDAGGDASTTSAAPAGSSTSAPAAAEEEEAMVEAEPRPVLAITAVSFTDGTVTVRNDDSAEVSLDGWFWCNRPTYTGVPSMTIAPGESAVIEVPDLDIRATGGEVGLYRSADFGSADAIVAYVQWGQGENGRASVAVEAGLIAEGEFIDNGGEDIAIG
ncbi:MAG: hypothetical protein AAGD35_10390 [Actinomycetota bacterium]